MEVKDNLPVIKAKNRKAWRNWLQQNHDKEKAAWLVFYKKDSSKQGVEYAEAVEEALCFGWIDSKVVKRDEESRYQYFTKRKPDSKWSRSNKDRVEKLLAANLMTEAGLKMIELAKEKGTWNALDEIDNLTLPPDLQQLFDKNPAAFENWQNFSDSSKKLILTWIQDAKKPETRLKRITGTVEKAEQNKKAY